MKNIKVLLPIMAIVVLISCKKENAKSEWDILKRVEIINPLTQAKIFQTPSLTRINRYLIEEVNNGIKTLTIATVDGDNLTVTSLEGKVIFKKVRNLDNRITLAMGRLSCQQTMRRLCNSSSTCSIAYTLSWWTMELIFASNCALGSKGLK